MTARGKDGVILDGDELLALWPLTFNFVRLRMGGEPYAAVEDIVGETFARAVERAAGLDNRESALRNWVLTVAGRLVIDHRRRQGRRRLVPLEAAERERGTVSVGTDLHARVIDLRAAVAALPPSTRTVLLGVATGLRQDEAGATVGLSRSSAHRRWHAGVGALRAALDTREAEDATRGELHAMAERALEAWPTVPGLPLLDGPLAERPCRRGHLEWAVGGTKRECLACKRERQWLRRAEGAAW